MALAGWLASPISWTHHWVWLVVVIPALWAAEQRRAAAAWAGLAASWCIWLVPYGGDLEYALTPLQWIVGDAYVLAAAITVGALARSTGAERGLSGFGRAMTPADKSRCERRCYQGEGTHKVFRQVPALAVVLPIAAVTFLGLLWALQLRERLTMPRATVGAAICLYGAGVVANTVFPIFLNKPASSAPWSAYVNSTPLTGYESADAVMNVVVFIPLGMIVPLVLARPSWWRVVAVATALSLAIELTQLITARTLGGGHIADINDLIFNVIGGQLGFALLSLLSKVPIISDLIDRCRLTDSPLKLAAQT